MRRLVLSLALAPLTTQPAGEHAFITTFLVRWGEALDVAPSHRRRANRGRYKKMVLNQDRRSGKFRDGKPTGKF